MRKVFNREGVLITHPKKILLETHNFYANLCKQDPLRSSENIINSFLNNPKIPKLSDDIRICHGKLTVNECYKSLKLFDSNKSPGNDGLTVEFYRAFSERYNIEGKMICTDFKKAFDTVSRDFLFHTLSAFSFGPSYWIHTFYNNISSCVLNNGFSTQPFAVERGVRQRDPLSPLFCYYGFRDFMHQYT